MQSYFLGANSREGFFSLYDRFPPDPNSFLHIIKGGPGTGKSSLMRAIANAAADRGLEVHCVYCSGDPDSLDGVYLPEQKLGWVDGTAPHVREPAFFGVDGDYLNLTGFFIRPFTEEEKQRLREYQADYRERYREAYRILASAAESRPGKAAAGNILPARFLSAISCKGYVQAPGALDGWDTQLISAEVLSEAIDSLCECGGNGILCLSPLEPEQAEGLLLHEKKQALLVPHSPEPKTAEKLRIAYQALREAKELHDRMEAVVRPHMDFRALSSYTERIIREVFS